MKTLVNRFNEDAGLLRRICDRVEEILDENRLAISDTCQKLNESALRKSNIELEQVNRKLRDLGRFKNNLMTNISHEFKTPLSSVRGYLEMMLESMMGPVSSEQEKGLSVSLKSIDRLTVMIEELVSTSRMTEMIRPPLSPERFRLADLIRECVEILKPHAEKNDVQLSLGPAPSELSINADRMKLHQALTNMLSNGIKFNKAGGVVNVSFLRQDPEVRIIIHDTGIGMGRNDREKIFDPYFQADASSSRQYGGMGIGLTIARDIIRMHGGRITVDSEEGRGSTFEILLPLTQERALFYS